MRKYNGIVGERDGYRVFRVCEEDADGVLTVVGYELVTLGGNFVGFYPEMGDALTALRQMTKDDEPLSPSPPRPSPSFRM
jgi:hypothetical protein